MRLEELLSSHIMSIFWFSSVGTSALLNFFLRQIFVSIDVIAISLDWIDHTKWCHKKSCSLPSPIFLLKSSADYIFIVHISWDHLYSAIAYCCYIYSSLNHSVNFSALLSKNGEMCCKKYVVVYHCGLLTRLNILIQKTK